jgi:very-short-patch-repair endonuclease
MKHDTRLTEYARWLRQEMAPAEKILRRELRGRRLGGHRFRRQQPFGAYFVDFYCSAAKLAVELDGVSHLQRTAEDLDRDAWIRKYGVELLRVWKTHVFDELDTVKEAIYRKLVERTASETK